MIATYAKGLSDQQKEGIVLEFYKAFEGRPFLEYLPRSQSDAFRFIDNEAREAEVYLIV